MKRIALFMITACLLITCNEDESPSKSTPTKSINVSPLSGKAYDEVTLSGIVFNTLLSGTTVTFNGVKSMVISATPTELVVQVPPRAGDGIVSIQIEGELTTSELPFDYIESHIVSTFAGSTDGFQDGEGVAAKFGGIASIETDAEGNVYVCDGGNHRIRKITSSGLVSTLAGNGTMAYADGMGTLAAFTYPRGIEIDPAGNLYVADDGNSKIRKITPAGVVSFIAGSTLGFNDGPNASAKFYDPLGVVVNADGEIFVADMANNRIRKIASGEVSTFAGSGAKTFADGQGIEASFSYPQDLAIDTEDNIYVADTENHRIRKITPSGLVSTLAGSTSGFADAQGENAKFNFPLGIAVDAEGNVYVADSGNNRIRKITPSGEVSTVAGNSAGAKDGPIAIAQLSFPYDVAVTNTGIIYVADTENERVRRIAIE